MNRTGFMVYCPISFNSLATHRGPFGFGEILKMFLVTGTEVKFTTNLSQILAKSGNISCVVTYHMGGEIFEW